MTEDIKKVLDERVDKMLRQFYINRRKFRTVGDRTFDSTEEIYNIAKQEILKIIEDERKKVVADERKRMLNRWTRYYKIMMGDAIIKALNTKELTE